MANKRCLPTRFFKDPDIMNLSSRDTQLILVGLVLAADDEGRELAHSKLLGRELDYPPEQIETALQDLADNDLLLLYQVGKHRYYYLTRWNQWQTLSSNKITPSKYPAPPLLEHVSSAGNSLHQLSEEMTEAPTEAPENPGKFRKTPTQLNSSESNSSESDEGEEPTREEPPENVTPFPTAHTDGTAIPAHAHIENTTREVAQILKLRVCHALTRLVTAYVQDTAISLLVEADAAREWIDDRQRNSMGKTMNVHFFRNWLKRERQEAEARQAYLSHRATGTDRGTAPPETNAMGPAQGKISSKYKSLMGLEEQLSDGIRTTQKGER